MSAGYIQLAAIGQQDAYLTGEPQVTYFAGVYKRHTPFVLEAYDIPFIDQSITYGKTSICRIPPKGDLIRGLTLKINLPALYNPGEDWTWGPTPSATNFPLLWFGFSNGTIVGPLTAPTNFQYYSTNVASLAGWFDSNFGPYASYNYSLNKFVFSNVSNVIVTAGAPDNSALSSIFWGLDPVNYTTAAGSNIIYNATVSSLSNLSANSISPSNTFANVFISTLTPDYTLQQSGWIQTVGLPTNILTGVYLSLAETVPTSSQQFLNFFEVNPSSIKYWTQNDFSPSNYAITPGGCIKFINPGYYTVQMGFNVQGGSVQNLAYGSSPTDGAPPIPSFIYTSNCTVSPNPSTPIIIPIIVTNPGLFYYFYVTTSGVNLLTGTYFSAIPVNDIYQLSTDVTLASTSLAPVPLYGNVTPQNSTVTLDSNSMMNFQLNGSYLISGSLSFNDPSYVANVSLGYGSNTIYTYDMSIQGRNPTFCFSMPLVANTLFSYYLNVSTTGSLSTLNANSFFAINQVGVLPPTQAETILPYNGILYQSTSNTLPPSGFINLASTFYSSNTNSAMITTTSGGNLSFTNVMSFMMTAVLYTSNAVSTVSIVSTDPAFSQQTHAVASSIAPPYTVSVPFSVSNTSALYSISVGIINNLSANVLAGTYISVAALASSISTGAITPDFSYCDSVGTHIIKNADLKIGGQTIQSITGEYIEIWNELNIPYENQPGLQLLTGKYDTGTSIPPPGRTYFINLPYYFYENPELSIPIAALGRQDVEVWVTFREFSELTAISVPDPTLSATIITEYVYLANPEINWFQNHQIDYVITQTQYQEFDLAQGFQSAVFELEFSGPIKELFFITQPVGNAPYDYVVAGSTNPNLQSLGMTFNGEDAFLTSCTNALYVGAIEPFNHHVNFFSKPPTTSPQPQIFGRQFFMYVFAKNPSSRNSSGAINFSRIRNVFLQLNVFNPGAVYPAKKFRVIATSQNVLRVENGIAGLMFD